MSEKTGKTSLGLTRRDFIAGTTATALATATRGAWAGAAGGPVIVTSWEFGPGANELGWPILSAGGLAIDAVEAAINHVELLPDEFYVGYGGSPNSIGETTLDAMMMWGPTHDVGAATGNGDVMMRFLPTYHAVELMREGATPAEAAEAALQRITAKGYRFDGAVVVLRKDGAHGAAKRGWPDEDFRYAVRNPAGAAHILVN